MKFTLIPLEKIIKVASPPKQTGDVDQIHPIKVRPVDNMFEIVDGHGRVGVAQANGEDEIWAQVEELDDTSFHLQSLAANLSSRENPMKMARDIDNLMQLGYNQSEISRMIGGSVSQSRISQLHSLTALAEELQDKLATGECPVKAGLLATQLPKEVQLAIADLEKITIKNTREILDNFTNSQFDLDDLPELPEDYQNQALVLNGDSFEKLTMGEAIVMEWNGIKIKVEAI